MDAAKIEERRAELHRWITDTHRLQRKLAVIFGALLVPVIAVAVWHPTVGGFALLFLALVAISSFWVTAAHTAAHQQKLDELVRMKRTRAAF